MRRSREERRYARERTPFAPTDRQLAVWTMVFVVLVLIMTVWLLLR